LPHLLAANQLFENINRFGLISLHSQIKELTGGLSPARTLGYERANPEHR